MRNILIGMAIGSRLTGFFIAFWQHFPDWTGVLRLMVLVLVVLVAAIDYTFSE